MKSPLIFVIRAAGQRERRREEGRRREGGRGGVRAEGRVPSKLGPRRGEVTLFDAAFPPRAPPSPGAPLPPPSRALLPAHRSAPQRGRPRVAGEPSPPSARLGASCCGLRPGRPAGGGSKSGESLLGAGRWRRPRGANCGGGGGRGWGGRPVSQSVPPESPSACPLAAERTGGDGANSIPRARACVCVRARV